MRRLCGTVLGMEAVIALLAIVPAKVLGHVSGGMAAAVCGAGAAVAGAAAFGAAAAAGAGFAAASAADLLTVGAAAARGFLLTRRAARSLGTAELAPSCEAFFATRQSLVLECRCG